MQCLLENIRVSHDQIVGGEAKDDTSNEILGHERDSLGDPNATISRITQMTRFMSKDH